jgi:plastocyanin
MSSSGSSYPKTAGCGRILFATIAASALAALFALAPARPARAGGSAVEVKMDDEPAVYKPAKVTIKPGDTVKWVNTGKTLHSVTLVPEDAQNPANVSEPKGAKTFDSGFMPPGGTFSYTFTVPGTYKYFCVPHEKAGMVGEVVVKK